MIGREDLSDLDLEQRAIMLGAMVIVQFLMMHRKVAVPDAIELLHDLLGVLRGAEEPVRSVVEWGQLETALWLS